MVFMVMTLFFLTNTSSVHGAKVIRQAPIAVLSSNAGPAVALSRFLMAKAVRGPGLGAVTLDAVLFQRFPIARLQY